MNNRYFLLVVLIVFILISCDGPGSQTQMPTPACQDPCPYSDISFVPIENFGSETIYITYGYSNPSVEQISGALQSFVPGNSTMMNLPLRNTLMNHFYFYSDIARTQEIGRMILYNNNPTYTPMCRIRVRKSGQFSTEETKTRVINTRVELGLRYSQEVTSHLVQTSWIQKNFSRCGDTLWSAPPVIRYQHFQFFAKTGSASNEDNMLSKVIYKNTNPSRINLSNITIK